MKYFYFWTDKVNANLEKKIMRCFDKTFSQISKKIILNGNIETILLENLFILLL